MLRNSVGAFAIFVVLFMLPADARAQFSGRYSCYEKTTDFQAYEPWFNSGIVLTGGESILLDTGGTVTLYQGAPAVNVRGFITPCTKPDCPVRPNYGEALARIGGGNPFAIQKLFNVFNYSPYPVQTGALEFMLNDSLSALSDNTGGIRVVATVCTGVTLYSDASYAGGGVMFTSDVEDLSSVAGPCSGSLNDCVSSLQIAPSWTITVFEHAGFTGVSATFTQVQPNLANVAGPCGGKWDTCISSFRLTHK